MLNEEFHIGRNLNAELGNEMQHNYTSDSALSSKIKALSELYKRINQECQINNICASRPEIDDFGRIIVQENDAFHFVPLSKNTDKTLEKMESIKKHGILADEWFDNEHSANNSPFRIDLFAVPQTGLLSNMEISETHFPFGEVDYISMFIDYNNPIIKTLICPDFIDKDDNIFFAKNDSIPQSCGSIEKPKSNKVTKEYLKYFDDFIETFRNCQNGNIPIQYPNYTSQARYFGINRYLKYAIENNIEHGLSEKIVRRSFGSMFYGKEEYLYTVLNLKLPDEQMISDIKQLIIHETTQPDAMNTKKRIGNFTAQKHVFAGIPSNLIRFITVPEKLSKNEEFISAISKIFPDTIIADNYGYVLTLPYPIAEFGNR